MVQNLGIFIFVQNFVMRKIWERWFQIWQYYFQCHYQALKYANQTFLDPNLRIFIFARNFTIKQIRGRWLQIWQQFFQIAARDTPNKAFLVLNLGIFLSLHKICNLTNSRTLISNITIVFQKCSPKYPNKVYLVPNLRIFLIAWNFEIWKMQ